MTAPSTPQPPVSVYIHVPFCARRCPYCDFTTSVARPQWDAYADAVLREWEVRRPVVPSLLSVYIGGGTPSLMPASVVGRMLDAVAPWNPWEVTIEINPGDADEAWLRAVRTAGVSRFSVGAQAMDDARLAWLGRRHGSDDIRRTVEWLRAAGCDNIGLDFIYGTPDHDRDALRAELSAMCDLEPEHVSCYELTLHEGTPLYAHRDRYQWPDQDTLWTLWLDVRHFLLERGMDHYEVSNFARPHRRSLHNRHYWRGGHYVGLGAGAVGTVPWDGAVYRYTNATSVDDYLTADAPALPHRGQGTDAPPERLDGPTQVLERVMMGLRTTDGFSIPELTRLLEDESHKRALSAFVSGLEIEGLVTRDNGTVHPTVRAMALADELAARLFP